MKETLKPGITYEHKFLVPLVLRNSLPPDSSMSAVLIGAAGFDRDLRLGHVETRAHKIGFIQHRYRSPGQQKAVTQGDRPGRLSPA